MTTIPMPREGADDDADADDDDADADDDADDEEYGEQDVPDDAGEQ